jgi:hypothetical protein
VRLIDAPPSWTEQLDSPEAPGILVNTVHGALRVYDLPDLTAALKAEGIETSVESSVD